MKRLYILKVPGEREYADVF